MIYDAQARKAYWLHIQRHFESISAKELFAKAGQYAIRIPASNRLNRQAIQRFAKFRDETLRMPPWETRP